MRNRLVSITLMLLGLIGLAACGKPTESTSAPDPARLGRGAALAMACSGCHSDANGAIASLASYSERHLVDRLAGYKSDPDGTTVMHRLARGYSDEDIAVVSAYLGSKQAAP